ncbi:MAG: ATP-binding protein [bacterium]|nr:ATP-binding protein [bacterium]
MDGRGKGTPALEREPTDITRFADSYESFNRIINSLQRKYVEIKDEFANQNKVLAQTNEKLVALTQSNLAATDFLNSVLNSIAAGVVAVDQNGRVTHFNKSASAIYGIPVEEPRGALYRDIIPPGKPMHANALRTAETSRTVEAAEKRIELDDGTLLQLSVSTSLLRDEQGRTVGAVEVFHDLTKIKKMEQEIARLNTLATLGEMAASIAHEVRNPLSGIGGFASLLEMEMEKGSSSHRLVKKIIRGVNNLNDTVTSLLNYTQLEKLNTTVVNYRDYIETEVERFRQENSDKLGRIELLVDSVTGGRESSFDLQLDRALYRQVITNILVNAADACGDAGAIKVKFNRLSRQTAVSRYSRRLLLSVDETIVETVISDTGGGIAMEHLEQLFAPFFTTKQGGHGLGLAISYKIVKAHGGDIFAESSSSKGTSFYILIPTRIDSEIREHH